MTRKTTFFGRHAVLVLVVVFFFVPFALRGARMSMQGMKNDVKDWLPKDFVETAELDWFREHFLSEQFVVVSWDGCKGDAADERFKMFLAKLTPETPPSELLKAAKAKSGATEAVASPPTAPPADDVNTSAMSSPDALMATVDEPTSDTPAEAAEPEQHSPVRYLHTTKTIGDHYGLYLKPEDHFNWGGQEEKWLRGFRMAAEGSNEEAWFYIVPNGDLYIWDGVDAPVASLVREMKRKWKGPSVTGTLIHSFGEVDGPWYYEHPRRLQAGLFKTVTTGPAVLASLIGEGGELESEPAEAESRLSGTLFGKDGKHTCMVLTLSEAAKKNLHLVLGRGVMGKPRGQLYQIAQQSNIAENQLRLGGPPVDNVAIDEEGSVTLFRLIGLCVILGIGLSLLCFRSISATIMVFFVGGVSAVISLAFVWWMGSSVDAIMMSMPALVYVLALAEASHLMNYYQEAVEEGGYEGAPERTIKNSWWPALLCNLTTSIGLLSLYTSELTPIRKFGVFSAIGVTATLVVIFFYMPAALQIWPQKRRKKPVAGEESFMERYLGNFMQRFIAFIVRHHMPVAAACIVVIAVVGLGTLKIHTSVNMLRMFHKDAKIIKDYEWLEANLGELVPMEVVVRVDKSLQLPPAAERAEQTADDPNAQFKMTFLERMELAARVQKVVEREFGAAGQNKVGKAMSAATFVRALPEPKGDTSSMLVRGGTNSRMEAHREQFLHSDYLRIDKDDAELWRVSLRVGATKGTDYGMFINELKSAVEPVLAAQREREIVLRQIVAQRGGKRSAGAKVLILGAPEAKVAEAPVVVAATQPAKAGSLQQVTTMAAQSAPIDQAKIFTEALSDLLTVNRLKVKLQSSRDLPENFDKVLAAQDCVVLVGNSNFNVADLKQKAKLVIDARNFAESAVGSPVVAAQKGEATTQASAVAAVYTGVVPIVYKAQRTLLESLIESTFWSFITILPLMVFISRSFWGGMLSMLPNVLPVLIVFGAMGWLKIDVDVGSMMTASIALGIAVDDTIHFLHWFREELDRVGDRHAAILAAYKHCATPTLQAAVMSGLGLSVFAISTFTPTQRFGYLMLAILWAGVAAELIFFPALLAGPLGAAFKPRKRKEAAPVAVSEEHAASEETDEDELHVTSDDALILPISTEPPVIGPLPGVTHVASVAHSGPNKSHLLRSLQQERPQPNRK